MLVRPVVENAELPMEMTLVPITALLNVVQDLNALFTHTGDTGWN